MQLDFVHATLLFKTTHKACLKSSYDKQKALSQIKLICMTISLKI